MDTLNRRRADGDSAERLVKLETDVDYMRESVDDISMQLTEHVRENNKNFEDMKENVTKLVITSEIHAAAAESHARAVDNISRTLQAMEQNAVKISSLEENRARVEAHSVACDLKHSETKAKLDKTAEKLDRLYWIIPIVLFILGTGWELLTHLKVL